MFIQNYFEKDSFIIRYDEGNHILIHEWKVFPTSQEFKEGTNILIAAFEHFKTGKLVGDVRQLGAVHPDDQQWILTDWISRARKAGFSHSATIIRIFLLKCLLKECLGIWKICRVNISTTWKTLLTG
ncbi:hypothetical protein [Ohtaekwangia koreensis]|uniref:Uncharacterized protein n=1 Tax=Ohtaekwangia koreensis TaxID=688867 RepID=A0A1T5KN82_9BACT|nr:hypothetical protein [Ohtaekwangia koreensis]SKC65232.1 hypothetical protein SAMN05660236_2396 [Ohtaekwangia koreensis]